MSRLRWGGSTPNHPAALRLGTQMGSDSPGQHEYIFSLEVSCLDPENHTRHTRRGEVRLAAAVPDGHCGGSGTSSRLWCGTLKRLGTITLGDPHPSRVGIAQGDGVVQTPCAPWREAVLGNRPGPGRNPGPVRFLWAREPNRIGGGRDRGVRAVLVRARARGPA